jgi:hypothetical protein
MEFRFQSSHQGFLVATLFAMTPQLGFAYTT